MMDATFSKVFRKKNFFTTSISFPKFLNRARSTLCTVLLAYQKYEKLFIFFYFVQFVEHSLSN